MSRWQTARLPDVAHIIMGQSPPGDTYNETGDGLPFFQGKAEFGEVSPSPRKWCNAPKKIAEAGDILMSVRAPVGPTNVADVRCCIGRGLAAIRANSEILDPVYLRFVLRHDEPRLASMGQGSTFAAIGRAELAATDFPLPPLPEQRRIVDLLSRAEGIGRLRREAEKKAAELIPALLLDMFGDPATNPKGWGQKALQDVSKISYGIADKLDTGLTSADGHRILTISNVLQDGNIDPGVERYCKATEPQIAKSLVKRGDLLFNWRNGSETHIGKTAIWEQDSPVLHVSFLLRVRASPSSANPYFLWAVLNHLRQQGLFIDSSRQQINRKFNASELSALVLPAPPIDMQQAFAEKVKAARSIQHQQAMATAKAQAAFDALLAHVFADGRANEAQLV